MYLLTEFSSFEVKAQIVSSIFDPQNFVILMCVFRRLTVLSAVRPAGSVRTADSKHAV